jgi:putative SOS response-associated peptidase YedK
VPSGSDTVQKLLKPSKVAERLQVSVVRLRRLVDVPDGYTGELVESCQVVTTRPNELVAPVHDRMPVILPRQLEADWLDLDVSKGACAVAASAVSG